MCTHRFAVLCTGRPRHITGSLADKISAWRYAAVPVLAPLLNGQVVPDYAAKSCTANRTDLVYECVKDAPVCF
eukprot:XP_001709143.1 Hypothetical protein GL50803_37225 [Giardia lamblia ATCC 50803]